MNDSPQIDRDIQKHDWPRPTRRCSSPPGRRRGPLGRPDAPDVINVGGVVPCVTHSGRRSSFRCKIPDPSALWLVYDLTDQGCLNRRANSEPEGDDYE